jgi:hypothetical protein
VQVGQEVLGLGPGDFAELTAFDRQNDDVTFGRSRRDFNPPSLDEFANSL